MSVHPNASVALPDGRELPAYLSLPVPTRDRPGPWAGVVVVHEAFGLTGDVAVQADWLAAAGYVAVVPDLFEGRGPLRCLRATIAQLAAGNGPAFAALDGTRAWLAARPDSTGRTGVIGYCMGGGFALLLASHDGYRAASVNYGQLPDDLEAAVAGACPVVASYGGRDRALPGAAERLRAALSAAGVEHDVVEYPRAGHSFLNRAVAASPLGPAMRLAGAGYEPESARDAKQRILAFFDTHLR